MTSHTHKPLFTFEMANNHMGDVKHGVRLITELGQTVQRYPQFDFALKLQYRELDTFIAPAFRDRMDIKYVKRFQETRLTEEAFLDLVTAIRKHGFLAMCTPFDEASVERVVSHGYDIIKVASASMTDWPLLERIASTDQRLVMSTAGATWEEIDRTVSFFLHRNKDLTIMHCVGEYPTPDQRLQLNQIARLRERYPDVCVGYSTHEAPNNYDAVQIAIALGARVFEKHVGIATERYALNAYSANPEQIEHWLAAAARAYEMLGTSAGRPEPRPTSSSMS